jgi:hypothetical protein
MFTKLFIGLSLFILIGNCSTTVDFIPEPDYSPEYAKYQKKSWEEVEIHTSRPSQPIRILGIISVRDFEDTGRFKDYSRGIKKDMFQKKMDGVWVDTNKLESVDDTVFTTMDSRDRVTHSYEGKRQILIWKGYAFRYK